MARYKKITTKTVEEWLELRKSRIGGSEIAAVVGLSKWQSKYELYLRKKGETEDVEENMFMRIGHKLEQAVAEFLQEEAGYQIIKNTSGNVIYLSEDYPFAEASPDRIAYLPGCKKSADNKCIVECKTTQTSVDPDDIPVHWICQVQWYMGITGIHSAVIAWLTQGRDFGYRPIPFDEEFFKSLAEAGAQFKHELDNDIVPDPVTSKDVNLRYPRHIEGKVGDVSEEVALACEKYKEVKKKIADLEKEQEEAEEIIKLAFADNEAIAYGGLTLATYKAGKDAMKFDAKTFKAENPEIAEKYTKATPSGRRLVVK